VSQAKNDSDNSLVCANVYVSSAKTFEGSRHALFQPVFVM